MANRTHIKLAAAVAAMLSVTAIATPALADVVTNFPGGYSHTWTGNHGEDFTVVHWNNTGRSTTSVDRHDGNGPVAFVTPPKPPVTKPYGGSLYNPDTNQTTSIIRGPGGAEVSMVEDNNTLPDHDFWWPGTAKGRSKGTGYNPATDKTITEKWTPEGFMRLVEDGNTMGDHDDMVMRRDPPKMPGGGGMMPGGGGKKPGKHTGHSSGSVYDPDTGKTTTIVDGPTGGGSTVEDGNTLRDHGDMMMPKKIKGRSSGSAYDPDTGKTTTVIMRPGIYGRTVEDGNTLDKHANMDRRMPRGRASGSVYDPDTNMTTSLSTGPTGWARSTEMGNTLFRH